MTNEALIQQVQQIAIQQPDIAGEIDELIQSVSSYNPWVSEVALISLRTLVMQYTSAERYVYVLGVDTDEGGRGYWLLDYDRPIDDGCGDADLEIIYGGEGSVPLPMIFLAGTWEIAYGPASKDDCVEFMQDMGGA